MHSRSRHAGSTPNAGEASCNLFFGIFPPPLVREAMAGQVARLRASTPLRARWSDPARYHVTVQFLGRFPLAATQPGSALLAALRAAAASLAAPAFELQVDTTGAFARSRVGWLGCTHPPPALHALWRGLGEALQAQGAPGDPATHYVPHVTVLRDARDPWPTRAIAAIPWPVDALVLARSRAGPGPYEVLDTWPLGQGHSGAD